MVRAASPGVTVAPRIALRRARLLPVDGAVLVETGQLLAAADLVARADLPGALRPLAVAAALGVPRGEIGRSLLVERGARVTAGQVLAESRSLFGLFRTTVTAPLDGVVESISTTTGQLLLRAAPRPVELPAFLPGRVVETRPGAGAVLEAEVSLIQGIFGVGGEAIGRTRRIGDRPGILLDAPQLGADLQDAVIATGGRITLAALRRLADVGARAVVAGSVRGEDLHALVGRELNLAATGDERLGFTLVITEGFGDLPMAARTFDLLGELDGREVAVSGATQVRAGVVRPELIGPPIDWPAADRAEAGSISPGVSVRIVRGAAFGALGRVTAIPAEPRRLGSGALAPVLEVELDDGVTVTVPRANVESVG